MLSQRTLQRRGCDDKCWRVGGGGKMFHVATQAVTDLGAPEDSGEVSSSWRLFFPASKPGLTTKFLLPPEHN